MSGPASSSERDLLIQLKAENKPPLSNPISAHKQNPIGHLIRLLKIARFSPRSVHKTPSWAL